MGGSLICAPFQNNRAVGKRGFVVTRLLFIVPIHYCFWSRCFKVSTAQIFSTENDSKIRFAIVVKENGANIESIGETCVHWKDSYYDENRVDRVRCPDRQDSHCFHEKSLIGQLHFFLFFFFRKINSLKKQRKPCRWNWLPGFKVSIMNDLIFFPGSSIDK